MTQLTPNQKHNILTIYSLNKNKYTFKSLAHEYNIKGGRDVIARWYHQWNGTPQSLERKKGSGRPNILTSQQVNDYIRTPIRNKNRSSKPVHYTQLLPSIQQKSGTQVSIQTVRRIGHEQLGVKQKRTKKRTAQEMSEEMCEEIADMRRKIQRVNKKKIIFMDEVAVKLNEGQNYTLVLPGEVEYVTVTDTTSYSKRYDMIALCNGERVLPPVIYTPKDRLGLNVKGITKKMLEQAVDSILAQAVAGIDDYPLFLVIDKACIHQQDLLQVFHDRGCQDVKQVLFMPTQAAKRMSPLDNALFHTWKNNVRKHAPLTEDNVVNIMSDE